MNRLTPEERRRVYLAQQQARAGILARLNAPTLASDTAVNERGRRLLFTAMVIAAMLGGGVLASQTFEFHPPASWVEALIPRL